MHDCKGRTPSICDRRPLSIVQSVVAMGGVYNGQERFHVNLEWISIKGNSTFSRDYWNLRSQWWLSLDYYPVLSFAGDCTASINFARVHLRTHSIPGIASFCVAQSRGSHEEEIRAYTYHRDRPLGKLHLRNDWSWCHTTVKSGHIHLRHQWEFRKHHLVGRLQSPS